MNENRPIEERGWVGVDLDGTLAEYHGWPQDGGIGKPIPAMLKRVKKWVEYMHRGDMAVRIMTARVCPIGRPPDQDCAEYKARIEAWCLEHIGEVLPVVYEKDFRMVTLYDYRCREVEMNTGRLVRDHLTEAQARIADLEEQVSVQMHERGRQIARIARLETALRVFADSGPAKGVVGGDHACLKERIVDWFGPSDFANARAALEGR